MRPKSEFENSVWFAGLGFFLLLGAPILVALVTGDLDDEPRTHFAVFAVGVVAGWCFDRLADYTGPRSLLSHVQRCWIAYLSVPILYALIASAIGVSVQDGLIDWWTLSAFLPIGGLIVGDIVAAIHRSVGDRRAPSN